MIVRGGLSPSSDAAMPSHPGRIGRIVEPLCPPAPPSEI
jgi:hypothetical protein